MPSCGDMSMLSVVMFLLTKEWEKIKVAQKNKDVDKEYHFSQRNRKNLRYSINALKAKARLHSANPAFFIATVSLSFVSFHLVIFKTHVA